MAIAIAAHELQKSYGKRLAVDRVDLRVEQGEAFGLVGPNGAGKTTMLRMLVDIIRPTSGELTVLGDSPRRSPASLRRRVGYLPGELKLSERIRGGQLLRHLARISGPIAPGAIEALADRLGLDLSRPVRTLRRATAKSSASSRPSCTGPRFSCSTRGIRRELWSIQIAEVGSGQDASRRR